MAPRVRRSAAVFYEDSRDAGREFAFHRLVVAFVVDESKRPVTDVNPRLKDFAARGVEKLVDMLDEDHAPSGEALVILVDGDRVHEALQCEPTDSAIHEAIRKRAPSVRQRVFPFVLRVPQYSDNLEGIIRLARIVAPQLVDSGIYDEALRKNLSARDRVFLTLSVAGGALARSAILNSVPVLQLLVKKLVELLPSRGGESAPTN